jgi:L-arabinose isomerase
MTGVVTAGRRRPKIGLVACGLGACWPHRVDFKRNPGEWADDWSASGVAHHWALGTGHRLGDLRAVASLLGVPLVEV